MCASEDMIAKCSVRMPREQPRARLSAAASSLQTQSTASSHPLADMRLCPARRRFCSKATDNK